MAERVALDAASVEVIARRVAELLIRAGGASSLPGLTAAEIAERLGTTAEWVRANADDLGGVRLGTGPKAPLRFDPEVVLERLNARSSGGRSEGDRNPKPKRRKVRSRRSSAGTDAPLLPIRDSRVAKSGQSLHSRSENEEERDGT